MQSNPRVPDAKLSYDLTLDKVDLVLIALFALDEALQSKLFEVQPVIDKARRFFSIDQLPPDIPAAVDKVVDELWNPLYEHRYLTPWDRLMAVDIDTETTTDDEAQAIIRDIEAKYGSIVPPVQS